MTTAKEWLDVVSQRLKKEGFAVSAGSEHQAPDVPVLAIRERFEFAKFGMETVAVFLHEIEGADLKSLEAYSHQSFERSTRFKKLKLPDGFGSTTTCFPVSYSTKEVPAEVAPFLEEYAPRHWAKIEFPVVVDLAKGAVLMKTHSPTWGAVYYTALREFAKRIFAAQP